MRQLGLIIMARKPKAPKSTGPAGAERRAAALRENLRRRKSQQRLRSAAAANTKAPAKGDG